MIQNLFQRKIAHARLRVNIYRCMVSMWFPFSHIEEFMAFRVKVRYGRLRVKRAENKYTTLYAQLLIVSEKTGK